MNPFTQHLIRFFKSYVPSEERRRKFWKNLPYVLAGIFLVLVMIGITFWDGVSVDPSRQQTSYLLAHWAFRALFYTVCFILFRTIYRCVYQHIKQRWEDTAL